MDSDAWLAAWEDYLAGHTTLLRALEAELQADAQLSLSEYDVLAALAQGPPGGLRVTELARIALLSTGGTTRLLDRMEAAGLVRRRRNQVDRRVVSAGLTGQGRALLRRATPTHLAGIRRLFAAHLDQDPATIAAFLRRLRNQWEPPAADEAGATAAGS